MTRKTPRALTTTLWIGLGLVLTACPAPKNGKGGGSSAERPSFTLAWSEYPSWSTFGVADEVGLINGKKGEYGSVEEKWNVDIVLNLADYPTCMQMYGTNSCDAVCITNMDILKPSLSRASLAILPTSTSKGADACIVAGINDVKELKGKKVLGLEKSVSEYCFVRNLELLGEKESDYSFVNREPEFAANAMQKGDPKVQAIVVWNPFVLSVLEKRKDTKVLFDSSSIPEEIIDMVVMGQDVLDKPGGERFACAVIEAFYKLNERLADAKTRDDTLVALGEKFSNLKLESMKKVCEQTVFYKDAEEGLTLFKGEKLPEIMERVVSFCKSHGMVEKKPTVGYGAKGAESPNLRFDPSYIEQVKSGKAP